MRLIGRSQTVMGRTEGVVEEFRMRSRIVLAMQEQFATFATNHTFLATTCTVHKLHNTYAASRVEQMI